MIARIIKNMIARIMIARIMITRIKKRNMIAIILIDKHDS